MRSLRGRGRGPRDLGRKIHGERHYLWRAVDH
jgi:hypothetical protein